VAVFTGAMIVFGWTLGTRHVTFEASLEELVLHCARLVLLAAVLSAASYLAIEPWIRRYWPHSIVTWSRLVAGRWRDPMVARDVLIGIAFGLVSTLIRRSGQLLQIWLGGPPSTATWIFSPMGLGIEKLKSGAVLWADILFVPLQGYVAAVQLIFLLFVSRVLVGTRWLSVCLAITLWFCVQIPNIAVSNGALLFMLLVAPLQIAIGVKYGLVASIAFVSFAMFTDGAILTTRLSAWYGESSLVGLLVVAAAALWAYRLSLGGQAALPRWRADREPG
jgi:serine/threonine-protein kinase